MRVPIISLDQVHVTFDDARESVRAVDDVSLSATQGEFVLLSGPSGAGKSTLLNVIAGLQAFDSGSVTIAGIRLADASDAELANLRLEHVGVVFQENNLIREFSASENVQLPLRARGHTTPDATAEAERMLGLVGLEDLGRRLPSRLSGGQRQRVGIARALVGGRSVLLADEPTGALDTSNSVALFELLRSFADDGVCVIVASHDLHAKKFADRVVHISDGRATEISPHR